ncbi:maleylacetate reductase [Pseudonocardia yuanmonensis]|uniref:Maleylacetate reductase n=1 Tax=Pseudonocardia yuanmonensis TaxID=1095914 RepID=A0ABP8WN55_9PSEU
MTGSSDTAAAIPSFEFTALPYRVLFGAGMADRVAAEVDRLGRSRVLLLASREIAELGDRVAAELGPLCVGRFDGAAMHTPVDVTEKALAVLEESRADAVVAVGGGSTTGLAKALALRTGVDQVVLPTTYAGSEVTPVLGETVDGRKQTRSDPAVLPETVVYDVELSRHLPVPMSVTSGMNALAHAVEALYSPQANPVVDGWATDAIRHLSRGIRQVPGAPADLAVRADLLRGAWLAGTCLGAVGMGLHHKLCHVLGGTFDLPHAATHTVVLAHVVAYNAPAVPAVMDAVAAALGVSDAAAGVFALVADAGAPSSLRQLGMREADLAEAADIVVATPYPNPRPIDRPAALELLRAAWEGGAPAARR